MATNPPPSRFIRAVAFTTTAFETSYTELRAALVEQPYLGVDESGHQDQGDKLWTWCFHAPQFTVFHIDPSRGPGVLEAILTETFGGVLGSDYFSAYHKYLSDGGVLIQFCWARPIRDIRFPAEHPDKSLALWGHKLLDWVRQLFETWHRAEPTNNQTEQAIRHIGIDHHITPGTRGKHGQQWCQRVWTVLATCRCYGNSDFSRDLP